MYNTLLGVTMIKKILPALAISCAFWACDSGPAPLQYDPNADQGKDQGEVKRPVVPVDYTAGRLMNARLGRGINLGNSWESDGADDSGWSNPIRDTDFDVIQAAGFNSVRIPVRWQKFSDYSTHTVDPERLKGVMEDVQLAINHDLAVVVNFHHYNELNCYGGGKAPGYTPPDDNPNCRYMPERYEQEKAHFLGMWAQVATALNAFPDNMVVFEILNEPVMIESDRVSQLMNEAYSVIRMVAPGKTIMFEAFHMAKFADLTSLQLPADGNIIYTGHFYAPYTYTHQGHGYDCRGDAAKANMAPDSLSHYRKLARSLYPDVDGVNQVPLNMGEFGVAGGDPAFCEGNPPSNEGKAEWAKAAVQAALENGMSFHYWGFGKTGGFDAYNVYNDEWYPGFPDVLTK